MIHFKYHKASTHWQNFNFRTDILTCHKKFELFWKQSTIVENSIIKQNLNYKKELCFIDKIIKQLPERKNNQVKIHDSITNTRPQ